MDSLGRNQQPQSQQQTMREYSSVTSDHVTDLATRSATTTSSLMSPTTYSISSPDSYHPSTAPTAAHSPLSSSLAFHSASSPAATTPASPKSQQQQQQPEFTAEQSDAWFKSVYQRAAEDDDEEEEMKEKMSLVLTRSPTSGENDHAGGGNNVISPVSYTSHRPFVDDSHRLRYQDIEDDEMHSNGSEENNHQGKFLKNRHGKQNKKCSNFFFNLGGKMLIKFKIISLHTLLRDPLTSLCTQ